MEYTESPEKNPYIYIQLIFNKGAKTLDRERNAFSTYGPETTRYPHEKNEFGLLHHTTHEN